LKQRAAAAELLASSLASMRPRPDRELRPQRPSQTHKWLTGIDVLERDGFKELAGLRIGLITNQTGRDRNGKSTIDVLANAHGVKLVTLFSPEHGIRGIADENVSDTKDEKTGLPIYSLYGESRRPSADQLKGLDALIYDIQDVGARFYTYITTLGYLIEEGQKPAPVFVLTEWCGMQ